MTNSYVFCVFFSFSVSFYHDFGFYRSNYQMLSLKYSNLMKNWKSLKIHRISFEVLQFFCLSHLYGWECLDY